MYDVFGSLSFYLYALYVGVVHFTNVATHDQLPFGLFVLLLYGHCDIVTEFDFYFYTCECDLRIRHVQDVGDNDGDDLCLIYVCVEKSTYARLECKIRIGTYTNHDTLRGTYIHSFQGNIDVTRLNL